MKPRQVMIVAYNSMTEAERAQFKSEIAALGEVVVFLPYDPIKGDPPHVETYRLAEEEPAP